MSGRVHFLWVVLTSLAVVLAGCRPTQPFFLHEDGDLSHYIDKATDLEYPDVKTTTLADVENAAPPLTLDNDKGYEFWDLTLEDAIKITLCNSKVMRSLGGRFVSSAFNNRAQTGEAPDFVLTNPDASRSVYDPAIIESSPFTGVEYALSAFDAQLSSSIQWQQNDHQQNILPRPPINDFFRQIFTQDLATFNAQLTKITAQGGQFTVSNSVTYDQNNNPTRLVPSDFNVNYQMQFNQPLLQGAGAQYNRIAGPFNPFANVPGGALLTPAFDGVLLARINVDITLADFEAGVRNLVGDSENAYWELYFAYRNLEATKTGRSSALQTWRRIHALYVVGARGGEAEKEAQAREQFYLFEGQVQTALNDLFRADNRLRYIMGIAASDCRLIRPADEPTTAKVDFDWYESLGESLARMPELRRQKWRVKERELEVIAARNLLLPRLDANGTYRWLGLGNQLLGNDPRFNVNDPFALLNSNAYQVLGTGQFQEWALGLQGTMTLGFRKEMATVRNYQLNLARERARLQEQELEVSHDLADAIRMLEFNYRLSQTNFNRAVAAKHQVDAVEAAFLAETVTLDLLLQAQQRQAEAQIAFFRALADYNRGIMQVHLRKGSLLEYNGVYLTEGPWPAKAQFDAHRLARQRDAGYFLNYGFTRPRVISQGPILQDAGDGANVGNGTTGSSTPVEKSPEEINAPTPAGALQPNSGGSAFKPGFRASMIFEPSQLEQLTAAATVRGIVRDTTPVAACGHSMALSMTETGHDGSDWTLVMLGVLKRSNTIAVGAVAGSAWPRFAASDDSEVRQLSGGIWKRAATHESVENSPSGPFNRAVANGQGPKC